MTGPEIRAFLEEAGWDFAAFPLYLTMEPSREDLELLVRYRDEVAEYRQFMRGVYAADGDDSDIWDATDFRGVAMGFFVAAKGVPVGDAYRLVSFMRYNLQDFDIDPAIKPREEERQSG